MSMINATYLFQLKDLQYEYELSYFSTSRRKYINMPNECSFDKFNRYDMVLMITSLQKMWRLKKEDCLKIERLIRDQLPETEFTQIEVADWLVLNWNQQASKTA